MNKRSANKRKQIHPAQLKPVYAAVLLAFAIESAANPMDATVVAGQASFATTGNTLTVVNTPGTVINWQSFSIGSAEITNFVQQSASSAVLNRVIGNDPSNILGTLQSNGRVFLINPHGIAFGAGSVVDVAGLVASTLNLSDADFQAGRYNFTAVPGAQNISNAGNITAQDSGQIYLIAPNVENSGVITAPNGEIYLAAGSSVELVNSNDPNLRVNITAPAGDATNVGQLIASSGTLGLFGTVVKNSGTVSADSATMQGGRIVFRASERVEVGGVISASGAGGGTIEMLADMQNGTVNVTGTLDASAPVSGDGGYIDTSAAHVQIADAARITTAAANGNSGNWLIDPTDFYVSATDPANGSSWMSNTVLSSSLSSGNVTIQTLATGAGNGDIFVNDAVSWASTNSLTLNAIRNIEVNAAISNTGTGNLILRSDMNASSIGTIIFGAGGSVALSGGGRTDLYYNPVSYTDATTKSDTLTNPYSTNVTGAYTAWMLVNDVGLETGGTLGLQAMNTNRAGNYAMGKDIDASATLTWNLGAGFAPIGDSTVYFTGQFDGQNHTISNLFINRASGNVGLFGVLAYTASVSNVGLVDSNVTGSSQNVGGLAGYSWGGISNAYTLNTSVTGQSGAGGLVGTNNGTIVNCHVDAGSSTISGWSNVGGLAGINWGTIEASYVSSGAVNATQYAGVGGVVGYDGGTVSNSHYNITSVLINSAYQVTAYGLYNDVLNSSGIGQFTDWLDGGLNIADYAMLSGSGGSYTINNVQGMKALLGFADNAAYIFTLGANIDLASDAGLYIPFMAADFNGANFTISNLNINLPNNNLGLFGHIALGCTVSNVNLLNATVAGEASVGALTGWNEGTISGSHVLNSSISSLAMWDVSLGGLVGLNQGTVSFSSVEGSLVSAASGSQVGGLVGNNTGAIDNSYVTGGTVTGRWNVGGLAGSSITGASILDSHFSGGDVSGSATVGGLVGQNGGSISNSYVANGIVSGGASGSNIGGLVGGSNGGSIVNSSVDSGNVSGNSYVGGLLGATTDGGEGGSSVIISNSHVSNTTVSGLAYVGGLAGFSGGDISDSSVIASGISASGTGFVSLGGLVGWNSGSISNSFVDGGTVTAISGDSVGGLVGYNTGTIAASWTSNGTVVGRNGVGGLVGGNSAWGSSSGSGAVANITGSYVSGGSVTGSGDVGGLVGYNASGSASFAGSSTSYWGSNISNSYVDTGTVVNGSSNVGGLVGRNDGGIYSSYANGGSVTGTNSVGGLLGYNFGTVIDSYALGNTVVGSSFVGGLAGSNLGSISNSFASGGAVSGFASVGGLVGVNDGAVVASFVSGGSVTGDNMVGGLVGHNVAGVLTSSWGGVIGGGVVTGSYVDSGTVGTMTVTGSLDVGGLVGFNQATIQDSFVAGVTVNGGTGSNIGGLVGRNLGGTGGAGGIGSTPGWAGINAAIMFSYVSGGSVSGGSNVGGLVGQNIGGTGGVGGGAATTAFPVGVGGAGGAAIFTNSYVSGGTVSGTGSNVGGLVGSNVLGAAGLNGTGLIWAVGGAGGAANINNSYASNGSVNGVTAVGSIAGNNNGSISNTFWNSDTAGALLAAGIDTGTLTNVVGYTTAQMMNMASFTGWNIANTGGAGMAWRIYEGSSMPLLTTFLTEINVTLLNDSKVYDGLAYTGINAIYTDALGNPLSPDIGLLSGSLYNGNANAGSYTLTTTGLYSGQLGYDILNTSSATLTVDAAALTVTAADATKTYGDTQTYLGSEFTTSGLVNGETIGSVTLTSTGDAATANVTGSPYAISASGATGGSFNAGNYSITYVDGSLTVDAAALTVTAADATKTYGGTQTYLGSEFTTSGLVNGETIGSVTLTSTGDAATANVTGSPYAISASGATGGSFNAGNYSITYVDGSLTVDAAALTVTAADATKTYGDTQTHMGTEFTSSGLVNGETIGSVTLTSAGDVASANVISGPYAITASSATGGTFNAGNYSITYADGQLNVTPASLTIVADDLNKVLTTADPLLTYTVSGLKVTDTVDSTLTGELVREAGEIVGTYQVDQGTLALNTGNFASSNYTMTFTPGTFTILAPTVINEIVNISVQGNTSAEEKEKKDSPETVALLETPTTSSDPEVQSLPVCQ